MPSLPPILLAAALSAIASAPSQGAFATERSVLRPNTERPAGAVLYRLDALPEGLDRLLLARDFDVVARVYAGPERVCTGVDIAVWPGQVPVFEHLFPGAERIAGTQSLRALFADEVDSVYCSPEALLERAAELVARAPDRVALVDLTAELGAPRTHGGRALHALRIGAPDLPSAAVVVGWLHAREAATGWLALDAAQRLVTQGAEDRCYWVVLCANPDGAEHAWYRDRWWRKNRRYNGAVSFGVDLNRNFAVGFGLGTAPQDRDGQEYRGPGPATEPEVAALTALLDHARPEVWIDLHTHGRLVLAGRTGQPTDSVVQRAAVGVASAVGYRAVRPPLRGLAIGEALSTGSLALLVEAGDRFHAPSADVRREADRLWTGIADLLVAQRPALRGVIRGADGGVAGAEISWAGPGAGVATRSRADGRFALWLPDGVWTLRVDAEGYGSETKVVRVVDGTAEPWSTTLRVRGAGLQSDR